MLPILAGLEVALAASSDFVQLKPTPFEFYLDVHDHNMVSWEVVKRVGLPVLSTAVALHDTWTMPLPCAYYFLSAAYTAKHAETLQGLGGDVEGLSLVYHLGLTVVPWAEKIPQMVYRGGCFLTRNPAAPGPYHDVPGAYHAEIIWFDV
ncbi:MAG: hypothetical protein WDW36_000312 [Sanguina aurantia]